MNFAVIGPPGAGKGTHAGRVVEKFGLHYVSTGQVLRENLENKTGLGFIAQSYMDQGDIVPRTIVDAMVVDFLGKTDPDTHLMFNGFPRTTYQANFLDNLFTEMGRRLDAVIYLRTSDQEITQRLSERVICDRCQAPFNQTLNPFKSCPIKQCQGEHLYRRKDDTPGMVQIRLQTYRRNTVPLLEYYQETDRLVIVDGEGTIEDIDNALFETVEAVQRHEAHHATREDIAQLQAPKRIATPISPDGKVRPSFDLIFLGAPGAGKGTQAAFVSQAFNIPRIATGDLFRENIHNETELGVMAKSYMDHGKLVPDEVTEAMVRDRLSQPDAQNGFILDGFPRNRPQAQALADMMDQMNRRLDGVVYLNVPDEEIIQRLSGRMMCRECQAPFHQSHNPFQSCPHGKCYGEHLYQRSDDAPETVQRRLITFHGETKPLVDYYRQDGLLIEINGQGELDTIKTQIKQAIEMFKEPANGR